MSAELPAELLADLRRAQDRDLPTEGIPMALALVDETGAGPAGPPVGAPPVAVGAADTALAARLDGLRAALAQGQRDGDLGVTASLLTAGAFLEAEALGRDAAAPAVAPSPAATPAAAPPGAPLDWRAHRDAVAQGRVLRVVNFHNTPRSGAIALREELARYAEHGVSVDLDDLAAFFEAGRWPDERPRWAPVFYEGYANSAAVAAPACDALGITGWFAVCTGFVACPVEQQELFARSHFIALAAEEQDGRRLAMTPEELHDVAARHVVYPHTASHDGIAEVVGDDDVEREVTAPLRRLQEWTGGRAAPAFAWMGGTPWGGSPRHDRALVEAGHRFVVSNTAVQRVSGV